MNRTMRFESKAASYTDAAAVQGLLAEWVAEWVEPAWPDQLRVLELGAGTGLLTRHLARRGRLTATDISSRMLQEGRRRLPDVRWEIADAWNPVGAPVDRLYSSAALHWTSDPQRTFQVWHRMLAPGGRMVHGLFVPPTLPELEAVGGDVFPLRWRPAAEWIDAAENAGFQVLRWETKSLLQEHANVRDFLRQLHDTGVTAARPRFGAGRLRSIIKELDRRYAGTDGRVSVTWSLLRFEASREGNGS
jgi:malonyl-CoA O-methyltransferase